ncbi:MAG: SDR family NAD(P)-dependent oxidoreductase [Oscillospiraceae bacterium]|jgi:NAD(P)-dependent dehydrogenase (short-subunit alcohol dehydrogenase family)|nr:SDR family NAD(P)-dependent oxidoreductase [Oscillospiraceae bacterium]
MTDTTAVVTGATSGIGLAAARLLAEKGVYVLGVGRDARRCGQAEYSIRAACPQARIEYVTGELGGVGSVRELAAELADRVERTGGGKLDILAHVAGAVSTWRMQTDEAYEMQFAVNHLAPFMLTGELMPLLRRSGGARVLAVSSGSHYRARIRWDDVMMHRRYRCLAAYGQSKLCNILFIAELARRESDSGLSAYAFDPGLVNTDIGLKGTRGLEKFVWERRKKRGRPPEVPAAYLAELVTAPEYAGRSGLYWKDGRVKTPSRRARDPRAQRRLWALSEELCGTVG